MPEQNRRHPAVMKNIEDINPQEDVRVRVVGTVLETLEDSIMLDDGSGTTEIFLNDDDLDDVAEDQRIRVFGRVLPTQDSFELQGEIVQDMSDLDMEKFNQVKQLVGAENL